MKRRIAFAAAIGLGCLGAGVSNAASACDMKLPAYGPEKFIIKGSIQYAYDIWSARRALSARDCGCRFDDYPLNGMLREVLGQETAPENVTIAQAKELDVWSSAQPNYGGQYSTFYFKVCKAPRESGRSLFNYNR